MQCLIKQHQEIQIKASISQQMEGIFDKLQPLSKALTRKYLIRDRIIFSLPSYIALKIFMMQTKEVLFTTLPTLCCYTEKARLLICNCSPSPLNGYLYTHTYWEYLCLGSMFQNLPKLIIKSFGGNPTHSAARAYSAPSSLSVPCLPRNTRRGDEGGLCECTDDNRKKCRHLLFYMISAYSHIGD